MRKPVSQWENIRPQKRLGQHFLRSKAALKKIIAAAELKPADIVIEIGPGTGVLTKELAKKVKKVIAIEKDKALIPLLRNNLKDFANVEIVYGDILEIKKLEIRNYKLIANLPYYVAARIIRKFLETKNKPRLMVLMVQKEVGQRICSQPPNMSLLAISVQFYADAKIIGYVKKQYFWPKPKVDSAIIKIIPKKNLSSLFHGREKEGTAFKDRFFKIVRAGFSQPRKQIINNLSGKLGLKKEAARIWLKKNKVEQEQRPQELSLAQWLALTKGFVLE